MRIGDIEIPDDVLPAICRRWKITRLQLFGSAVTGRLREESDLDLLVDFDAAEEWSLMDLARAEGELSALFGRRVDLVDRRYLERSANPFRRDAILSSAEVLYAA